MKKYKGAARMFTTKSPADTQQLGMRVARHLNPGDVILLMANLGAGKTTFVQGLVKQLGVKDQPLSPTFILAQTLQGKFPIHHLDFYRVTPKELLDIGIEDYLSGVGQIKKGVVVIEWADRCKQIWPENRLEVHIRTPIEENTRVFTFQGCGDRFNKIVQKI